MLTMTYLKLGIKDAPIFVGAVLFLREKAFMIGDLLLSFFFHSINNKSSSKLSRFISQNLFIFKVLSN